jgi:hypothetical protein
MRNDQAMSEEIEKFDPSTLADKVRERIRNSLADLIPEEQWTKLIETSTKSFFEETYEKRGYGNERTRVPSGLETMVVAELKIHVIAELKKFFNSPEWADKWDAPGNGTSAIKASEAIRKMVIDNSDVILGNVLGAAIQSVVQQIRTGLLVAR